MSLKWGIAGAGLISHDFVNALQTLNKNDHKVIAIAAQDLSRSKDFAKRFDLPKAYESYIELAKNPDVEVVYIGVINSYHQEVAQLMLDNGKHVLVEKPMCLNEKQARKLIECARSRGLFLMEGIWSRMFPCYQYIRQQIQSGVLGEIVSIECNLSNVKKSSLDRITKNELGGGAFLTMGVYSIQLCQWVFQKEPISIEATGILNDDGVDFESFVQLNYGDNNVGKIKTSVINTFVNGAKITGTNGTLTIPKFCCPTFLIDVDGTEKTFTELPKGKYEFNYLNSGGFIYEVEEVRKCIRAGKIESEFISHDESLQIARIEDEIRKQIGVKYDADNE